MTTVRSTDSPADAGTLFRRARRATGLRRREAAFRLGLPVRRLSAVERGSPPTAEEAAGLCRLYGLPEGAAGDPQASAAALASLRPATLGVMLRLERERLGIKQADAAARVGCDIKTLGGIETDRRPAGLRLVCLLSALYGFSLSRLDAFRDRIAGVAGAADDTGAGRKRSAGPDPAREGVRRTEATAP